MKKGEMSGPGMLGSIFLILFMIGLMIFILPKNLFGGLSDANLAKCMGTYDLDGDTLILDDDCKCDYGKSANMETYPMQRMATCIFEKDTKAEVVTYKPIAKENLLNSCFNIYKNDLTKGLTACQSYQTLEQFKNGIPEGCAQAVLQKAIDSNELAKVCRSSNSECEKNFRENPRCKTGDY